ncbi:MAG TPA: 16S rRNA (guanine(966)-N(2))-methyltransferase RsmD [Polyangiaceae bacterium]
MEQDRDDLMRVIAGSLRGRPLLTAKGDSTRPTGARVREALFSILGELDGARVLDLYAGSGALAIEALSRGAARAVLVESGRAAQRAIRSNLSSLGIAPLATLLPLRAEASFGPLASHGPFELVFADPPWADAQAALGVLEKLVERQFLAPGARLVLEHAARDTPLGKQRLALIDRRTWGDTAVTIFEHRAEVS